jgi:hypothetical protein
MYVQYIRSIDRQPIVAEDTLLWLSKGDLKGKIESEIIAAQDREIKTKFHTTKILKTETDNNCKLSTILYQHAQDWQKNNMLRDLIECVLTAH